MLFNSFEFLLFLPIVFLLYWFVVNNNLKLQNLFVLAASYLFYGWWDWRFLLLIFFTSFCSYFSGLLIYGAKTRNRQGLYSGINIAINIGILGFFKYYNFFVDSFTDAFGILGLNLHTWTLNIILPVGISFYTFQALSYSIDVYSKKVKPTKNIIAFFAYVSFFPQLVAGPIERATNFLPQFYKKRTFDYSQAVDGMRQILWGFFKKIVVADTCATHVDQIFNNYESLPASALILGVVYFAFQIYGDFSGYSDIAIGTARLFGFNLMRNFNYPYFSRDIAEFWRRWHISLTTWFRDYLYIPMGGSRVSQIKIIRNVFVIFLVSGFWHGANWTFIIWGLLNAIYFLPLMLLHTNRKFTNTIAEGRILPNFRELIQVFTTFLITLIAWVFFRSNSVGEAFAYLGHLADSDAYYSYSMPGIVSTIPFIFSMVLIEWGQRNRQHGLDGITFYRPLRWTVYLLLCILCFAYLKQDQVFIYFQF